MKGIGNDSEKEMPLYIWICVSSSAGGAVMSFRQSLHLKGDKRIRREVEMDEIIIGGFCMKRDWNE